MSKDWNGFLDRCPGDYGITTVAIAPTEGVWLPVQRYNEYHGEGGGVCENDEGDYVKYSDYVSLYEANAAPSPKPAVDALTPEVIQSSTNGHILQARRERNGDWVVKLVTKDGVINSLVLPT